MNTKRALCTALCLSICIAFSTACNHENMSKVTIHFGQIPLAKAAEKQDILDRILDFFLPRAYAAWTSSYNLINLTISGDGMDTITAIVPPNSVSYTVEVPMGEARLFTLFAYQGSVKKWGGHVLADTNDSEVILSMNVFPIVTNLSFNVVEDYVDIIWDRVDGATGYKIYQASNQLGPFTYLTSVVDSGQGQTEMLDDYDPPSPGTYYFRVSVYYTQGEGEPCDAQMVYVPY